MEKELVFFKGTKTGVQILLNDTQEFEKVLERLKEKLATSSVFFVGSQVSVNTGTRKITEHQTKQIQEIMQSYPDLTFIGIEKNIEKVDIENFSEKKLSKLQNEISGKIFTDEKTCLIKKTIRSGQTFKYDGNIVIFGDINAGAEVVAGKDVFVIGKLRGSVWAGYPDNKNSIILALRIQTPEIKIAQFVAKLEEKKTLEFLPEFAYIQKDKIIIKKIV